MKYFNVDFPSWFNPLQKVPVFQSGIRMLVDDGLMIEKWNSLVPQEEILKTDLIDGDIIDSLSLKELIKKYGDQITDKVDFIIDFNYEEHSDDAHLEFYRTEVIPNPDFEKEKLEYMNYLKYKEVFDKEWMKVKDVYDRIEEYYNTQSKYAKYLQLKKEFEVGKEFPRELQDQRIIDQK